MMNLVENGLAKAVIVVTPELGQPASYAVDDMIRIYHDEIESDRTYGAAYYRGERAERQINWWLGYLAWLVRDASPISEESHLLAETSVGRRMLEAQQAPGVARQIEQACQLGV